MRGYAQMLRAEVRKLLTVRSTYYVFAIMFALELLFSFFIFGYHISSQELAADGANYLQQIIYNAVLFLAVFSAIIAVLLVTQEYRHNTILYTLTASPSRLRVFLSKLIVVSGYAIITTGVMAVIAVGLALFGGQLAGHHVVGQSLPLGRIVWQVLFYGWAIAMIGFNLAIIFRNQVIVIVALLILPNIIEPILTLLLKENSAYLPFTAAGQVIGNPTGNPSLGQGQLSPGHAALVVLVYVVVGWAVGLLLFNRRSAL